MSYQIISRQYRPSTFAQIVGQDPIVETLKNALRKKKIANAYLFCGGRGSGKTTLARLLAKALGCTQLTEEMEPCNSCLSCLELQAGRSLDVLEIDGASNRGIDDIRSLNETVGYAPAIGKYKIYIIDEVHMLTKEAFNALLKTLEEPPKHVKFFLATTEPHKVPLTIISRCQRFDLKAITPEAICHKLKKIALDLGTECEEELFSLIASRAEGSLRDAESLLDQAICWASGPITAEGFSAALGIPSRSTFFALDRAFETENLCFAFELAQEIFSSGRDSAHFLDLLLEHYHALLRVHLGRPADELTRTSARLYTQDQCLYIIDYIIQWRETLSKVPFKRLFLEMVLLHILRSKSRLDPRMLVQRLIDLEARLYQNNVKDEKLSDPISEQSHLEPVTLTREQGASENQNCEVKPTRPKTDSSGYFGIKADTNEKLQEPQTASSKKEAVHPSRYATLMQFAAVELEGIIKK